MFFARVIFFAYTITVISEIAIILVIQKPQKFWQWILGIFLINSFTHPIAIYLLHMQNINYILVELGVLVIEAIWYTLAFQVSWRRAFILSAAANIFSILVGSGARFLFDLYF